MSTSPELEDVSPTLARAVLPTYLHHVADASETLAVFARKGLSKNEAARSELVAQIELQREVCRTPLVVQSDPLGEDTSAAPFSRPHTPLSPGARAAKRAADDEKLGDLEGALREAHREARDIEKRLHIAEGAVGQLRGAPRELRAVVRLLHDVITDLEAGGADEDEENETETDRRNRRGSGLSSGSRSSAYQGKQEAIASAAAILQDAQRVDPTMSLVTGARVTQVAAAAADAADALLARAQQCLEEEAKFRALLGRAREARRVNSASGGVPPVREYLSLSLSRDPGSSGGKPSFKPPGVGGSLQRSLSLTDDFETRRNGSSPTSKSARSSASSVTNFSPSARSSINGQTSRSSLNGQASEKSVWSPGGGASQSVAAKQSDATAKAQARRYVLHFPNPGTLFAHKTLTLLVHNHRAIHRRSLTDARTQKRVARNLEYHISRLEFATNEMSTEADALESHLKRVEKNHAFAAGKLDTLAWLLDEAESFRNEAARRETERARRRGRRFAPSGASVRKPHPLGIPLGGTLSTDVSRPSSASSYRSSSSVLERWTARVANRSSKDGNNGTTFQDADDDTTGATNRNSSGTNRSSSTGTTHRSNTARPSAPSSVVEHWREKYARERDFILSRESNSNGSSSRRGGFDGTETETAALVDTEVNLLFDEDAVPDQRVTIPEEDSVIGDDAYSNSKHVSGRPNRKQHDDSMLWKQDVTANNRKEEESENRRAQSHGRLPPSPGEFDDIDLALGGQEVEEEEADVRPTQESRSGTHNTRGSPLRRHHRKVMRRKRVDTAETDDATARRGDFDDETTETENGQPSAVTPPEIAPTPPTNRVLALGGETYVTDEVGVMSVAEFMRDVQLAIVVPENEENERRNEPRLAPESSLDAIEAELAELCALELEEFQDSEVPFGSVESGSGEPGVKKKKKTPLPEIKLKPKPKPRAPWGPPPQPPKSNWKRNDFSRLEIQTLIANEKKERKGDDGDGETYSSQRGSAVTEAESRNSSVSRKEVVSKSPRSPRKHPPSPNTKRADAAVQASADRAFGEAETRTGKKAPACGCVVS
jgi:hypothetical protein